MTAIDEVILRARALRELASRDLRRPAAMLVGGGDRSASDPIQQIQKNQQSEAEDFPNRGTYLRSSSHTGSEVAFVHLADLR